MNVRSLLSIVFVTSLVVTLGFIAFALKIIWLLLNEVLPSSVSVAGTIFPTELLLIIAGTALFFLLVFLYSFLFLLIDRVIVKPIKIVSAAMHEFAQTNQLGALPDFSKTSAEVKELSDVFVEFTGNVAMAHARDMEVSRMKSDFISTAAHQLRTPMTGIRWALEALQKSGLNADQQLLVDSAVGKSHDLVNIIGTLLDISAIESGKYNYKFESVDMNAVLEGITKDFGPLAQTRQISLIYVKSAEQTIRAKADVERIKWVLNNLVENAIRYTPAGGSVQLSLSSGLGRLFVRVRDTGIGIKAEDRTSIFERFYRAPNAIQKENAGNGLGLYIARTIAKDHGGDLNFEANSDGPGTTFIFSLMPA
jgi:signal transduction histidine kinase